MRNIKSLYVHIPFCVKKCLFCSFAVSIGAGHRVDEYLRTLEYEALQYKGQAIKTVYLGGGTPSFLNTSQMKRLVEMIKFNFQLSGGAEWSMESNPEGIDEARAKEFRAMGFKRISLGVQSFNDAYLKFLGRAHDKARALASYQQLRNAGFNNINIDLMYGFPGQTRQDLSDDIETVVDLNSEHVSIYTLTVEPNSRFHAKQMKLDSDEKLADDYIFVTEQLEKAGLKQYEVSNFARAGCQSAHNRVYWEGGEYIGLGLGAHSFVDRKRFWNTGTLNDYIERMSKEGQALGGQEELSDRTMLSERLIFGLRMNEGVNLRKLEEELEWSFPNETHESIKQFIEDGFLIVQGNLVKTTLKGRLVLDTIAARLI